VKSCPDLTVMPLGKTLSAINAAGLAGPYQQMYLAYKNTGLFDGQSLHQIAQAIGARYLVELKLGSFDQQASGGVVSFLGLSLGHKATADLRLTLQIWDSQDGKVVWERSTEQSDTKRSFIVTRTVKMADVETSAAEELIRQLPR
jgi:Curli production assembly/transport component CsgG